MNPNILTPTPKKTVYAISMWAKSQNKNDLLKIKSKFTILNGDIVFTEEEFLLLKLKGYLNNECSISEYACILLSETTLTSLGANKNDTIKRIYPQDRIAYIEFINELLTLR